LGLTYPQFPTAAQKNWRSLESRYSVYG